VAGIDYFKESYKRQHPSKQESYMGVC
jgi:hypothetical protein